MKKFLKKIIHPFYKRYHFWSHKKSVKYTYKTVYTIIQPNVFSPKNTLSTRVFLNYISRLNLEGKSVLELGCGSGIIALFCAAHASHVTASDINKPALESLKEVSEKQGLMVEVIYSDLFAQIKETDFDYIFINPPYYPKNPKNIAEKAWFCGHNFEYYQQLFLQLTRVISESTTVLMILSDDCEHAAIKNIALQNALTLREIHRKKLLFETNNIYQIVNTKSY